MTSSTGIVVTHVSVKPPQTTRCHKIISGPTLDQVPIVCEYPDVFPDELPGMPPDQDIEFIIELIPGTGLIAQRPYRMNPAELVELKKQLDDLLSKGVTTQDFIKFWGKIFAFVLLEMIGNSQGFKNFLSLFESFIRKLS
jgi:hypothetical protein